MPYTPTEAQKLVERARHEKSRGLKKRLTAGLFRTGTFQGIEHYLCADGSRFAISHNGDEVWAMPKD